MNAARSLARGSRLVSYRGFSTALKTGKVRPTTATVNPLPKQPAISPIWRPMSSAAKFEVMNIQDDEDFKKRVLDSSNSVPIIVDFHATWCGPCKLLGPKLESLLSKEGGKVLMAKVDIDDHPELAMEYGVQSVPTVVGVKNGQVLNKFVGDQDHDKITSFVDKLIVS